jgi:hypothetical protein
MTNIPPKVTKHIALEIPSDLEPIYANLARISHSPAEIIIDFARILPGQPKTRVLSRLLMSPIGIKMFYRALGENLSRYEASYGEIKLPGNSSLASSLFKNIGPSEPPPKEE